MFDITQIKSALKNKSLDDDMKYINEVLSDVIYAEEFNDDIVDIDIPNYRDEIDSLKKDYHVHKNMSVLNKITNEMVDSWNSASPSKLSQLINDSGFVTKENVEDIINELTGDILNRVILTSESGKSFILTTDSNTMFFNSSFVNFILLLIYSSFYFIIYK